jgi:NAD-dependent deacetylase
VELERRGALRALVTQNIDRLHLRAGSSPELVLELHGNMVEAMCTGCDARSTTEEALARLDAGEDDPRCRDCGAILKTATVMFGESLDAAVLDAAVAAAADCDQLWAVGTTLHVHPAAGLCDVALAAGAELVIVNGSETAYDDVAHRVVRDSISLALPLLVQTLRPEP